MTYRPGRFSERRFCHGQGCAACDGEYLRSQSPLPEASPRPAPTEAELNEMYANVEASGLFAENPRAAAIRRTIRPEF